MLKLYDRDASGNSYKIRLMFSFLNLAYETVPVAAQQGKNIVNEAYLQLNPRGQIPTLDDNGFVVWGSTAILTYVAARYDKTRSWLPEKAEDLGQVMQWMELAQNEISTGLARARAILKYGSPGDLQSAQTIGYKALDVLEKRLQQSEWLAGSGVTIADIACFPHTALCYEGQMSLANYKAVHAWVEGFKKLEGFVSIAGIN